MEGQLIMDGRYIMKIKFHILLACGLAGISANVSAQHETDSIRILQRLIVETQETDSHKNYFQALMDVYDREIESTDTIDNPAERAASKGKLLGRKSHDYILFAGKQPDIDRAYGMVKEAAGLQAPTPDIAVLQDLVEMSLAKMKKNPAHTKAFIQDYLTAYNGLARIKETADTPEARRQIKYAEDTVNSYFISSGTAGCERLQAIFGPEIASHKTDLIYLKQVISILKQLRCTGEDVYYEAVEAAHNLEPTPSTALGCAYKYYYKTEDIEKSLLFFDQAVSLEPDMKKKAEYCYRAAVALYSRKMLGKAKEYARKALSYDEQLGKAYLLIAQMYASSPNWSNEETLNKCTYYAAIDKLQRAKEVDPDIAEEAQKLIVTYAAMTPKDEDLFFIGLKKGNTLTIGGWIKETTTIK